MLQQLREQRHKPCLVSLIVFTTILFVLFAYVLVPIALHKKHKGGDCGRDLLFKTYDNNNGIDENSGHRRGGHHGDHPHGHHGDHPHGPHGHHGDHPHGPHGPHGDHPHGPHGPHGDHPHGPHGDHRRFPHDHNEDHRKNHQSEQSDNPDDDERLDKHHKKHHHHHHHNKTDMKDEEVSAEDQTRYINKDGTAKMGANLKLDRKDQNDDDDLVDKRHKKHHHHHHHHNKTGMEDDEVPDEEKSDKMGADLKLDRKDQSDDEDLVDKHHKKHHHHHHHNKTHVDDDEDNRLDKRHKKHHHHNKTGMEDDEVPDEKKSAKLGANLKLDRKDQIDDDDMVDKRHKKHRPHHEKNFKLKHSGSTFNQFQRKESHKIWRGLGLAWIIGMIWQTSWLIYAVANIFRKTSSGYLYTSAASPIKKCTFFFFLCALLVNMAAFVLFFFGSHVKHAHLIASIMSPMSQLLLVGSLICSYANLNKVAPMLKKEGYHRDIHRTRVLLHNGLAYFVGLSTFISVMHLTVAINFVFGHWDRLSKEKVFAIALIIQFFIYTVIDLIFIKHTRFTLATYLPILIIMAHQIIRRPLLFVDERLPFFIFGSILLMMVIKFTALVFILCRSSRRHKLVRSSVDGTVYKMPIQFEPPAYSDLQIESEQLKKIPL